MSKAPKQGIDNRIFLGKHKAIQHIAVAVSDGVESLYALDTEGFLYQLLISPVYDDKGKRVIGEQRTYWDPVNWPIGRPSECEPPEEVSK